MDTKDYRLELKVKNNLLYQMMLSAGCKNAAALGRATGISNAAIGRLLNLQQPAYLRGGKVSPSFAILCDFFKCDIEDICPPEQLYNPAENNVFIKEVSAQELKALNMPDDPLLTGIANEELEKLTDTMLSTVLDERSSRIVRERNGIGCEPKLLKEISKELGISGDRVNQLEHKAYRALRASVRGEDLRDEYLRS
jgi:hypothetical protein